MAAARSEARNGDLVKAKTEYTTELRLEDHESMVADLSPAEPEPTRVTRLQSRGGRSERECGLSSTLGHTIEEYSPRAQQFADARSREVLRALDLEKDLATARRSVTQRPRADPIRDSVRDFAARHPELKGRALGRAIAFHLDNEGFSSLLRWKNATGKRLWRDLWDCKHLKTRAAVRKFIYSRLLPVDTSNNLPHMLKGA
jgi:hypothetical protein